MVSDTLRYSVFSKKPVSGAGNFSRRTPSTDRLNLIVPVVVSENDRNRDESIFFGERTDSKGTDFGEKDDFVFNGPRGLGHPSPRPNHPRRFYRKSRGTGAGHKTKPNRANRKEIGCIVISRSR